MKNTLFMDCAECVTPLNYSSMRIDIDKLIRENIERLLRARGLTAAELARKIDTTESYLSDIRRGIRSMGTDLQSRICEALNIEPWEFYWTEKTPIIADTEEQKKVYRYREEKRFGIAEDIAQYEEYRIEKAKERSKKSGTERVLDALDALESTRPRKKRSA